ncbi:MAG: hypothetical protein NTZ09_02395, partial [Candidatus Hydrogenedentes bacterium]|nr:hypothetical protein [Candidatus Hydrogenedentota bacterium]
MIIRHMRIRSLILLPVLIATAVSVAVYAKGNSSPPDLDLSILSAVAPGQKYEDLATAVQSNAVPEAGFSFA